MKLISSVKFFGCLLLLVFLSSAAPALAQQDGEFRDGSGNTIGSARGVRPEYAAAFFFFFFKEM